MFGENGDCWQQSVGDIYLSFLHSFGCFLTIAVVLVCISLWLCIMGVGLNLLSLIVTTGFLISLSLMSMASTDLVVLGCGMWSFHWHWFSNNNNKNNTGFLECFDSCQPRLDNVFRLGHRSLWICLPVPINQQSGKLLPVLDQLMLEWVSYSKVFRCNWGDPVDQGKNFKFGNRIPEIPKILGIPKIWLKFCGFWNVWLLRQNGDLWQ